MVELSESISDNAGSEIGVPSELTTSGLILHPKGVNIPENARAVRLVLL